MNDQQRIYCSKNTPKTLRQPVYCSCKKNFWLDRRECQLTKTSRHTVVWCHWRCCCCWLLVLVVGFSFGFGNFSIRACISFLSSYPSFQRFYRLSSVWVISRILSKSTESSAILCCLSFCCITQARWIAAVNKCTVKCRSVIYTFIAGYIICYFTAIFLPGWFFPFYKHFFYEVGGLGPSFGFLDFFRLECLVDGVWGNGAGF